MWQVPGGGERELVFPSPSGTPIDADNLRRDFAVLPRQAGLPRVRWHDLRHTYASLLLSDGVPVLYVANQVGHSSAAVTLANYAHGIPDSRYNVVDRLDETVVAMARTA